MNLWSFGVADVLLPNALLHCARFISDSLLRQNLLLQKLPKSKCPNVPNLFLKRGGASNYVWNTFATTFFLHMGRHHCKLRSLTLVVFESWSCNASEVQKLKSHTRWDGQNQHVQCWLGGVLELRHCSRDAFHQFCFQKHGGTEQNARPILALPGNTLREDALHQLKHILCNLIFTDHIRLQYFYTKIIPYLNVTHGNTISSCNSSWCSTPEFRSQICKASILDPC